MRNDLQAVTTAAEPAVSRRLHAAGRKKGVPVSGTFELTAGCNFNCANCYVHAKNAVPGAAGELTAAQWLQIGKEAAAAGTVFLLLTGGEPLLRPDFAEIYTGLKKMGFMISVNTNGSLLTGETAALMENNPPSRLNVSLYADTPAGYLRQCGADAFGVVTDNIRRMVKAGVQVKLNISFTEANADRYAALAALARELGLHVQASAYMYPPVRREGGKEPFCRLSPEAAADVRVQWDLLRGEAAGMQKFSSLLERLSERACEDTALPGEGVRCRAGHTSYWINAGGRMLMCGMIPAENGSVLEEGFNACWQKTRAFMQTITMPAKCTACRLRPVCCVCPAACYAESGDFTAAPAYLCRMSERIAADIAALTKNETPAGK